MKWFLTLIALSVVILSAGCTETLVTTTTTATTTTLVRTIGDSLEVTVYTDKGTYAVSEGVEIYFKIKNISASTFEAVCPNIQQFYFIVSKEGSAVWTYPRLLLPAVSYFTLMPGSTEIFSTTWDQTDNSGTAVSAGNYSLTGYLCYWNSDIYSTSSFTIQ